MCENVFVINGEEFQNSAVMPVILPQDTYDLTSFTVTRNAGHFDTRYVLFNTNFAIEMNKNSRESYPMPSQLPSFKPQLTLRNIRL